MNTLTLTHGLSARKISVQKEQIIALDAITTSITRIYMKGGTFRDVAESVKTVKNLVNQREAGA